MEYVYAAMLLHKAGQKVDEAKLRKEVIALLRKQKVPLLLSVKALLESVK